MARAFSAASIASSWAARWAGQPAMTAGGAWLQPARQNEHVWACIHLVLVKCGPAQILGQCLSLAKPEPSAATYQKLIACSRSRMLASALSRM